MKGIGIETVTIKSIRDYISSNGNTALNHLFTDREREQCLQSPKAMQTFAGVMAAKEAFLKACPVLRCGGNRWGDMEIFYNKFGSPEIELSGKFLENSKKNGIDQVHLSISHSDLSAMAFVVVA